MNGGEINIVVKPGWILERMARELQAGIPGVRINAGRSERAVDERAAIHYYMPAKDVLKYPQPGSATIGLFTHGEVLSEVLRHMHACTAMNERMGKTLRQSAGMPVEVICPGTEPAKRPPVFGVIGRAYTNGRKGQELVQQAVAAGYHFVACEPAEKVRATRHAKWHCPTTHTTAQRDAFYASIDYLVVTALEEGGPMPVLEAVARHVPVIAPDVGFCWEFPVIRYERGSWDSLQAVLRRLAEPPTWANWIDRHQVLFARLLGAMRAA